MRLGGGGGVGEGGRDVLYIQLLRCKEWRFVRDYEVLWALLLVVVMEAYVYDEMR